MKTFKPNDYVAYVPGHAHGELGHKDVERGHVSEVNDLHVFVKFYPWLIQHGWSHTIAKACSPEDLVLLCDHAGHEGRQLRVDEDLVCRAKEIHAQIEMIAASIAHTELTIRSLNSFGEFCRQELNRKTEELAVLSGHASDMTVEAILKMIGPKGGKDGGQ